MNTLSCQHIGQPNACSQHSHPHFTTLWFGTLLFDHLQRFRSAVMGHDDSLGHVLLPREGTKGISLGHERRTRPWLDRAAGLSVILITSSRQHEGLEAKPGS